LTRRPGLPTVALAIGERTFGTLLRHVLPNIMAPIVVIFSITIGSISRHPGGA
jgi:ABC-type dipeptide/oligopeptide/nickel transport system permease subunit